MQDQVMVPPADAAAATTAPAHDFSRLKYLMDDQRSLIRKQVEELQRVVVLQCQMTGTNPLAQEMAAAVMGKKSGRKGGEPLTPKALKFLYNVFSIKDTITKKEAREISALCGATVTQVREFFSGQRSRVRKLVQLSHEDAGSDSRGSEPDELVSGSANCSAPEPAQATGTERTYLSLLDCVSQKTDSATKKSSAAERAQNLLTIMRQEDTFGGQSELAHVILQADEPFFRWFMIRGGLQLIIKWLTQAVSEEQTSLIRALLKIVGQLPLGSALPMHMSALLQTVNKLRFYRAQDVASRARSLLSKWSRFLRGSHNGKLSAAGSNSMSQPIQKRNRDNGSAQVEGDTLKKKSKSDNIENPSKLGLDAASSSSLVENPMEPLEAVPEINPTKKRPGSSLIQGTRTKERRKVQLFEEARVASRRKEADLARPSSFDPAARPLSADDIKKAKRRAQLLQSLSNKSPHVSSNLMQLGTMDVSDQEILKGWNASSSVNKNSTISQKAALNEGNALETCPKAILNQGAGGKSNIQVTQDGVEQVFNKEVAIKATSQRSIEADDLGFNTILWSLPPRLVLDPRWRVATGHESTENSNQYLRIKTEQEVIYATLDCIPSNPQEPLERGSLFVDDTLVPELLLETLDEDSQEKDCSLQSPRETDLEKRRGQEADSKVSSHSASDASGQGSQETIETRSKPSASDINVNGLGQGSADPSKIIPVPPKPDRSTNMHDGLLHEMTPVSIPDSQAMAMQSGLAKSPNDDGVLTASANISRSTFLRSGGASEVQLSDSSLSRDSELEKRVPLEKPSAEQAEVVKSFRSEQTVQTPTTSSSTFKLSMVAPLVHTSSQNDVAICLPVPEKGTDAAANFSLDSTKPPVLSNQVSKAQDTMSRKEEGTVDGVLGLNLSELSKEACLDMLKVVLQQLADNSGGSGADLELLSMFLKNPDLVYALTSSQSIDLNDVANLDKVLSMNADGSNQKHLNISQAERVVKDIPKSVESMMISNDFREKVMFGIPPSAPPSHAGSLMPSNSGPAATLQQSRLPLPQVLHPVLPAVDQTNQTVQSHQTIPTQFLGQSPLQSAELLTFRQSDGVPSQSNACDWSQHAFDFPQGPSGTVHITRHTLDKLSAARPNLNQSTGLGDHPHAFHGSSRPPGQSPIIRSSQPKLAQMVPPNMPVDGRAQAPIFLQNDHTNMNSAIQRLDGQMNRLNGLTFAAGLNPHFEASVNNRDAASSIGILRAPTGSAHPENRFQQPKMPALMPNVRGVLNINHLPPLPITYNGFNVDHKSLHPRLSSAQQPPPPLRPFSPRPQGDAVVWQHLTAQSANQKSVRPNWREH